MMSNMNIASDSMENKQRADSREEINSNDEYRMRGMIRDPSMQGIMDSAQSIADDSRNLSFTEIGNTLGERH